jgi:hypothetical protein
MSTDPALPALAGCLARVVGPEHVLADPAVVESYVRDRTEAEMGAMPAVERALDPGGRLGHALLPSDGARRPG